MDLHDVRHVLDHIRDTCTIVLGDNLTGIYVHGSIAFGCFTWERSDVDFLVVVQNPLSLNTKTALLKALLSHEDHFPPKGIEMSVLLESDCRNFIHPMHYELHYSAAHRADWQRDEAAYCCRMQGTDRDLAAHCTVVRHVGIAICGKPIDKVFAPVPVSDYLDSLHYDIDTARDDISENPTYIILNLCRVLAYLQDGVVLSKQQGGEWGIIHLDSCWEKLLRAALMDYAGHDNIDYSTFDLAAFADEMCMKINAFSSNHA